jgi:hypothetical protein
VKRGGSLSFLTVLHFCRSRVIGFDMTEKRIFTLCRMITWVVFLRMFWNFISSLPVKRGGSLSLLVGTISNVLVMEIGWTDVGSGGYILVSCAHSNTSFGMFHCCFISYVSLLFYFVCFTIFLFRVFHCCFISYVSLLFYFVCFTVVLFRMFHCCFISYVSLLLFYFACFTVALLYPPQRSCRWYTGFTMSVRPSVDKSYVVR